MNRLLWLTIGIGVAAAGCAGQSDQPPFRLIGTMHEIMEGAVAPQSEIIWDSVSTIVDADGIHEHFPQNDVEWEIVEHAAIALAESTNLLIVEGRVRDGGWVNHLDDLVTASLAARDAALAQDKEAIFETGEQIYNACTACHLEYVPQ
jgi:hypothetical protein